MSPRERIRAAMRHEPVDRVPVMCQLALGHYFLHSGRKPSDIWFDTPTFVDTLAEFQQGYGFDGFLLNLPGRPANWRDYLQSVEPYDDGERLVWQFGMETIVPADDNPHTFLADHQDLPRAEYANVDPDDPKIFRLPGYVWNTWHAPTLWDIADEADLTRPAVYPDWLTSGLRLARASCPDVSVHMEVFSPFTHLLELFGYQSALMALIEAEDTCHRLLDQFTRQVGAQVECFAPCQPDAILISSAFAGGGFISRQMYVDFVVPYERRVVDAIHNHALPAYVHTCGKIGDRLDLMADTGVDGIDTLDPPPLGTVDLAKAKEEFGGRFFFKGNLDAVNEMLRADDAAFEDAVKRRLAIGAPGSGYILSSACSVAPGVQPERLRRMVELSRERA
ncbi:MAG: uroporphyrinogen decarboxylase family protein [Phycisphaerae bacterium]|nr:uroporphyrinogen decarboxylase family protein [Phycisphaerae bacterium]